MFNITPGRPFYEDLWANQILFWSVVIGCASVPLAIYVPGLNTKVFYMRGISEHMFVPEVRFVSLTTFLRSLGMGYRHWNDCSLHYILRTLEDFCHFQPVVYQFGQSQEREPCL